MKFKLINILDSVNVLQKVQGHSRQRHCLILNLKESKFAEFFISRGIALYGIEFRPYLSVLGRSVTKRLVSSIAPMFRNWMYIIHNVR